MLQSPISLSISLSLTRTPLGCEPIETIVPDTISTYLNTSGYFSLHLLSIVHLWFSSIVTASLIVCASSSDILSALHTSFIAPFIAIVLNVIISLVFILGKFNLSCSKKYLIFSLSAEQ